MQNWLSDTRTLKFWNITSDCSKSYTMDKSRPSQSANSSDSEKELGNECDPPHQGQENTQKMSFHLSDSVPGESDVKYEGRHLHLEGIHRFASETNSVACSSGSNGCPSPCTIPEENLKKGARRLLRSGSHYGVRRSFPFNSMTKFRLTPDNEVEYDLNEMIAAGEEELKMYFLDSEYSSTESSSDGEEDSSNFQDEAYDYNLNAMIAAGEEVLTTYFPESENF